MRDFYVDKKQPGVVRGGFYDEMGGMLVGTKAKAVCDVLNAAAAPRDDLAKYLVRLDTAVQALRTEHTQS